MIGVDEEDRSWSSSARSRSDRLDSEPVSDEEPVPPARRRWRSNNCSADVFMASIANSQDARDNTRLTSEGPPTGVDGADR
jgi:hypothetical protein